MCWASSTGGIGATCYIHSQRHVDYNVHSLKLNFWLRNRLNLRRSEQYTIPSGASDKYHHYSTIRMKTRSRQLQPCNLCAESRTGEPQNEIESDIKICPIYNEILIEENISRAVIKI